MGCCSEKAVTSALLTLVRWETWAFHFWKCSSEDATRNGLDWKPAPCVGLSLQPSSFLPSLPSISLFKCSLAIFSTGNRAPSPVARQAPSAPA
ncbi:hypothetical protein BDZ91DRAFT_726796 [Kalaharituber pfeilii]|nr:hypothetical protein BDZ91DRAFT_726796 [Kalaharituber pfeilii]